MGAVLGLAAYGRTQEKLNGANNGGMQLPANVGTTYTPPAPIGQPATGGFGAPTPAFGSPAPTGFGGNTGFGAPTSGPVNSAPSWGTTPIPAPASFPPANVSTNNIGAGGFPKFSL